jgi:DNA ligase-1
MYISPMLFEKSEEPFNDPAYIFEPQIDGLRLILSHRNSETRLYTLHNHECTRQFPELWDASVGGDDYILDGEVCSLVQSMGAMDYEQVMERFRLSKKDKIRAAANQRPVHYVVFDILQHNGRDLRSLPLIKRKSILESILKPNLYVSSIPFVENQGIDLYKEISAKTTKGIVGKRKDSLYVRWHSQDWMKVDRISKD